MHPKQHWFGRLLLTLLISAPVYAEIYKHTDESGHTVYSDNPKGTRIEPVDLPTINTQPSITPKPAPTQGKTAAIREYRLTIVQPADETYVSPGQQELEAIASIQPRLQKADTVQFFINGAPEGSASRSTKILLTELHRGQYRLSAKVINSDGDVLASSEEVTFFVQRPIKKTK